MAKQINVRSACGLLFFVSCINNAYAQQSLFEFKNWATNGNVGSANLASATNSDVKGFVTSLGKPVVEVCSFKFLDTDKNGWYELIASVDYSGRHFCNTVILSIPIVATPGKFMTYELQTWNVLDVENVVQPVGPAKIPTLVLPQPLTGYDGPSCVASWPVLYRVSGENLNNVSSSIENENFYRMKFSELSAEVSKKDFGFKSASGTSPGQASTTIEDPNAVCKIITLDKLSRLLRFQKNAGYDHAVEWMNSSDPALRTKAIQVFSAIGDSQSLGNLRLMSKDKDKTIASLATRQLSNKNKTVKKLNWGEQ